MASNSYATLIEMSANPEIVFNAISTKLGDWWGEQSAPIQSENTVFKVSWGLPWYEFKVVKFEKNELMIWKCTDAHQIIEGLEGVEKEWVGTKIHWNLKAVDSNSTQLYFTHEGLVPQFVCFNFCSATWDRFLKDRLVSYVEN